MKCKMEIVLTLHLGLEITFDLLKLIRFILLLPLVRCELEGVPPNAPDYMYMYSIVIMRTNTASKKAMTRYHGSTQHE